MPILARPMHVMGYTVAANTINLGDATVRGLPWCVVPHPHAAFAMPHAMATTFDSTAALDASDIIAHVSLSGSSKDAPEVGMVSASSEATISRRDHASACMVWASRVRRR